MARNASIDVMKEFCIHPLYQNDADLIKNLNILDQFSPTAVGLCFEYRHIANSGTREQFRVFNSLPLSILPDVNEMLLADKVQNYHDFLLSYAANSTNFDRCEH
jgi:hypothetical protein